SLARGFKIAEQEFDVKIIGGDTNESKELVIDCCMVGIANHIIKRSGAKEGELIVTSGPFGYSASGLKILLKNARAKRSFKKKASQAVLMPKPRLMLGLSLTKFATSAMDSSDGLAFTLYELSQRSGKRFIVDSLPTTSEVKEFARKNRYNFNELVFYGGEEYEIVATIQKRYLGKVKGLAKKAGSKLFIIGRVEKGKGVLLIENGKEIKIEKHGWEHLSRA
ncbi:MAG: thiamine-monophosphate kinase, partial [Nitrososphaerales archaeon]